MLRGVVGFALFMLDGVRKDVMLGGVVRIGVILICVRCILGG